MCPAASTATGVTPSPTEARTWLYRARGVGHQGIHLVVGAGRRGPSPSQPEHEAGTAHCPLAEPLRLDAGLLEEGIDLPQEAGADGLQVRGNRHRVGSAEAHVRTPAEAAREGRVAGRSAAEAAMREMIESDVHLDAVRLGAVNRRLTAASGNAVDVE